MLPKRKHITLTIQQKSDILERLERGESGKALANEYKVGSSTISDIKKNKTKIRRFIDQCDSGPGTRKSLREAEYPEMDNRLFAWFCLERSKKVPISYETLSAKAKEFYTEAYGNDDFKASRGWISNFKKRHGLRDLKGCEEKMSNAQNLVDSFLTRFTEMIEQLNLTPAQIYNAGETALYWKMLPEKMLHSSHEMSKECFTFQACCNADGSQKLKLLVIGKVKNPRVLKNADIPVDYKSSSNGYMNKSIFLDWFHSSFIHQVRNHLRSLNLPEKALLIVDNASINATAEELTSEDGQFTTLFLPSNYTTLLQPIDQNAIKLTKLYYRKSLLAHLISNNKDKLFNIDLKDAVCLLYNAWEKISPEILQKCWDKIMTRTDTTDQISFAEEITDISNMLDVLIEENVTNMEIHNWLENDDLSSREDTNATENQDSENETTELNKVISDVKNEEAVKSFSVCIKWAEENNVSLPDLLVLQRLRESALVKNLKNIKRAKTMHK